MLGPAGTVTSAILYFNMVQTGGPWDYKNTSNIGSRDLRIQAGNVNYGATCFFGSAACQFAAGLYGKLTGNEGTWSTHFDDPKDNQQISQGIGLRGKCE